MYQRKSTSGQRDMEGAPPRLGNKEVCLLSFVLIVTAVGVAGVFEDGRLSKVEEDRARAAASDFLKIHYEIAGGGVANAEGLEVQGVRFNRYDGLLVHMYGEGVSLVVSEEKDQVVSFNDMRQRHFVENCGTPEVPVDDSRLMRAREHAREVLASLGKLELVGKLILDKEELGCFGKEQYFRFAWTQDFGKDGVAPWLATVELYLNPESMKVYSYSCSVSSGAEGLDIDAERCAEIVREESTSRTTLRPKRMAAFLDHDRNGDVRPAWAVWVDETEAGVSKLRMVIVDGKTGAVTRK